MTMAHETAGAAIGGNQEAIDAGVVQMFDRNSVYYVLGYSSADVKKFHHVKVTVDRPEVEVAARDKYYWPDEPKPPKGPVAPLLQAIAGVLPKPDLPLRAVVAPFAMPGQPGARVAAVLRVSAPPNRMMPLAGDVIDLRASVFDAQGHEQGKPVRESVRVNARSGGNEYEILTHVDLKPGPYELRFSAASSLLGVDGSVYLQVDVPEFAKLPVSLSGIVFTLPTDMPSVPKDALASLLPVVPTAQREFSRSDRLSVFARVYQGGKVPLASLPLHVRILDAHDHAVVDITETLGPDRFDRTRATDYRLALPFAQLPAGEYLLTMTTSLGKTTATRDVRFAVTSPR